MSSGRKRFDSKTAFYLGIVCTLVSSLAFATGWWGLRFPAYQRIFYIISSLQFWIFLAGEIVLYIISAKMLKGKKFEKDGFISKCQLASVIAFAVSLAILIAILIIYKTAATFSGLLFFSLTLFLFQMIFVLRTEIFKNKLSKERTMKS